MSLSREADTTRIEAGRFPENVDRSLCHSTLHPADHSGKRYWSPLIGDHHIITRECIFDAIESEDFLPIFCHSHRDIPLDLVGIEYMHRLTELSHDTVGDIDEIHLGRESCTLHHETHTEWTSPHTHPFHFQ